MPKNVVACDIDQTLAGGVVKAHLLTYNSELYLAMDIDQIEEADKRYAKTFDVPQIQEYRARGDTAEKRFQEVRTFIRTSPEVHLNFSPLPSAATGVMLLIDDKNTKFKGYYTVRPKEIKNTTREWLRRNQLPYPEQTTICDSHEDKLRKVLADSLHGEKQSQLTNTKIVIIDDSVKQLTEAAYNLVHTNKILQSLIKHVVIVGFGVDEENKNKLLEGNIYPEFGLQTLALPSWQKTHVEELIDKLRT